MNHSDEDKNFSVQNSQDDRADLAQEGVVSEQDLASLKRAQKRNIVIAIVLGLILMVSGFYAGRALRSTGDQPRHGAHAYNAYYSDHCFCEEWSFPRMQN